MKTLAIIQARMASTRLPGKVLADIHGRPMLRWLLDRVESVRELDEIVVATTTNRDDDELVGWLRTHTQVDCFRGSEDDVLDRFFCCARGRGADVIVRVTADDPLKDPGLITAAVDVLRKDATIDYCSNSFRPTYPEGLDIEVFRHAALERVHREATLPAEREHVTPYIWQHPDRFRLHSLEFERDLSDWRWTVDRPADLEFVRAVYQHFIDRPLVSFREIIAYIEQHPAILQLNAQTIRREGYRALLTSEKT